MYGWIWRHLPGPLFARLGQAVLLLALAVLVLFTVVFPWAEPRLPFGDVTVSPGSSSSPAPSPTPSSAP